ncbi:MAG: hypothetical protein PUB11_03950 [Oscillospiraceae bacterium]|nr:hypothetical protein [Oscillospiraceae bacterium]
MNKAAALYNFYSKFLPAYEENSVPDDAELPYITYQVALDNFTGTVQQLTASIWYRDTSWAQITEKAEEIREDISRGGTIEKCDGGRIWITRGQPFAQYMADDTKDEVKRIVLNISAEFITAE